MTLREKMDQDEAKVVALVGNAFAQAYFESLKAGRTVLVVKDGWLVKVKPDETTVRVRRVQPRHTFTYGQVLHLK